MTDDARAPLDRDRLRASLPAPWRQLDVVDETESTNADLAGAPAGSVLVAEFQRAGRGRLDRSWSSPPRAGLLFSALVQPPFPPAAWGWLPLLTGVAVCDAVAAVSGRPVALKWPNDVLIGDLKLAGILVQASGPAAIIGVGLNVSTRPEELPVETATSLALAGAPALDRTVLLSAILAELGARYLRWTDAAGDAAASGLAEEYRSRCATIGRPVMVTSSTGERAATAVGIEDDGRLRVRWSQTPPNSEAEQSLAAADIVHLRVTGLPVS